MKPTLILIVIAAIALLLLLAKAKPRSRKASGELSARQPLTPREQAMFYRLQSALPEHVILAQVAFSSLVTTRDRPTRSTFDRKVCDFVVCSKAFQVIAVVEIDDASHRGREGADAKRDALLEGAGYRVVRFAQVPDVAEVRPAVIPAVLGDVPADRSPQSSGTKPVDSMRAAQR